MFKKLFNFKRISTLAVLAVMLTAGTVRADNQDSPDTPRHEGCYVIWVTVCLPYVGCWPSFIIYCYD